MYANILMKDHVFYFGRVTIVFFSILPLMLPKIPIIYKQSVLVFNIFAIRLDCLTMFNRFYRIVGYKCYNALKLKNHTLKLYNLFMNKRSLYTSHNKLTWPVFSNQPYRVCLNYFINLIIYY